MEAVLSFIPPEERIKYSALTGQDPQTGRMETQEYHVEGPVMIFLTTTAVDIDEELLNRCLVLTVDEGREQTAAIHRLQRERETLAGLLRQVERNQIMATHRAAQRLLRPLAVVNPFAEQLTFLDDRTRARRDHPKYLALIRCVALLHQDQREVKTAAAAGGPVDYIEVTAGDIAAANRLAHEVLGRTLDEMPPQTRRLLELIESMVAARCSATKLERPEVLFRARQLREFTGWANPRCISILAAWSPWNTSSATGPTTARAWFTNWPTMGAARTAAGFCPAYLTLRSWSVRG